MKALYLTGTLSLQDESLIRMKRTYFNLQHPQEKNNIKYVKIMDKNYEELQLQLTI